MVERQITDGRRIGELLASELTGLDVGVLGAVEVVDADADASPDEGGTQAYRVAYRERVVASVWLYPDSIELRLHGGYTWSDGSGAAGSRFERVTDSEGPGGDKAPTVESEDRLRVDSGAAVKRAVDALRVALVDHDRS